ncbi:MAG: TetR/AcrR family transcriptional regulator [Eubacteriales bacterium]|nr:TetR/AcrR family transcriptional regulator [Eubacteriales bacterium]
MNQKRKNTANLFAKECIVSALLQLIYEKPLSAISVSELCRRAGVSRMTFYRNYDSKEDIFLKQLEELFAEYRGDEEEKGKSGMYYDRKHMLHYFTYLSQYRDFMAGLIACGFGTQFLKMLMDYLLERWSDEADYYTLAAFAGSLYSMFHLWASGGYEEKPELLATKLEGIFGGTQK